MAARAGTVSEALGDEAIRVFHEANQPTPGWWGGYNWSTADKEKQRRLDAFDKAINYVKAQNDN